MDNGNDKVTDKGKGKAPEVPEKTPVNGEVAKKDGKDEEKLGLEGEFRTWFLGVRSDVDGNERVIADMLGSCRGVERGRPTAEERVGNAG